MDNILVQEQQVIVERTENNLGELDEKRIGCGETDPYESFTDNIGELFRSCQKEHGRCVSKMYIEPSSKCIGWVFEKTAKYTDTNEPYILETWVTLHTAQPDTKVTHHYKYL